MNSEYQADTCHCQWEWGEYISLDWGTPRMGRLFQMGHRSNRLSCLLSSAVTCNCTWLTDIWQGRYINLFKEFSKNSKLLWVSHLFSCISILAISEESSPRIFLGPTWYFYKEEIDLHLPKWKHVLMLGVMIPSIVTPTLGRRGGAQTHLGLIGMWKLPGSCNR